MATRVARNEVFWTKQHCFAALYAWVREHDCVPSENTDWHLAGHGHPSGRTIVRHFGSWSRFILVAGLEPQRAGMKPVWTRELIADWLLDHLLRTGEWPTVRQLRTASPDRRPSYCTITRIFGSITAAKRFAGWDDRCANCEKRLPKDARSSQRWCSVRCRRASERSVGTGTQEGFCVECGAELENNTIGCTTCGDRARRRVRREALKLAAPAAFGGSIEPPRTALPSGGGNPFPTTSDREADAPAVEEVKAA